MSERAPRHEVLLVGIGEVGETHRSVLERIPGVALIAGVDPARERPLRFRGATAPVYQDIGQAAANHSPTLVVVATPTTTHRTVAHEVADAFPHAEILLEKPASDDFDDAKALLDGPAALPALRVGFHMAFSPEVSWGLETVRNHGDRIGHPVHVRSTFADPYEVDFANAQRRFSSSWVDSGINALSVIDRFAPPVERTSLRRIGPSSWSAYEGTFISRIGEQPVNVTLVTTWHVTDPAKTTRILYTSGAELVLDHTAVAGYLFDNGTIADIFGTDGSIPRRETRYRQMYQEWFAHDGRPWSAEDTWRLHRLLLTDTPG